MSKTLRWKLLTILAVVGLAIWAFTPPTEKVRLGLDLKGGVHLVMRVQTDDALRVETEAAADRLREALRTQAIGVAGITVASPSEFRVAGVPTAQDAQFRQALVDVDLLAVRSVELGARADRWQLDETVERLRLEMTALELAHRELADL